MEVGGVRQVQNDLGKDVYLRLFAEQARNQNPFDPIKGDQFLSDLAQFGALEQMTNVNTNFGKLLEEIAELKASRAAETSGLADLAGAEEGASYLAELRAAEGMLERSITFTDPATGNQAVKEVNAVLLQDGQVWLETDSHALNVSDVQRIEP